jgi:hypothetical protein
MVDKVSLNAVLTNIIGGNVETVGGWWNVAIYADEKGGFS